MKPNSPREKKATMASPDPNSKRSKRRAKRGFVDLQTSSRKHRRMRKRQHGDRKSVDFH